MPGHEIVGQVSAVGQQVTRFKIGDTVGVGCIVDSCQQCASCRGGEEQYCTGGGFVGTYNGLTADAPGHTLGGYSQRIVVDEKFVLQIRHPQDQLAAVAPLLCAGITTYSPLRHWNMGPGKKVGVERQTTVAGEIGSIRVWTGGIATSSSGVTAAQDN